MTADDARQFRHMPRSVFSRMDDENSRKKVLNVRARSPGARHEGMLVRLGRGQDGWALGIDGVVEPMYSGARRMQGWVRAAPHVYADEVIRRRVIGAALGFVRTLPRK